MASERGFSLVEMLLSVVIISLLVGLSLPIYRSFTSRNDLDLTTQNVAQMLRRAQTYARGVKGDSQWGVRVSSGSAVLFKGSSYTARDANFDETTAIQAPIAVSGLSDIVFTKLAAVPSATGTIVLSDANINDTRTVIINAEGMVSY
jgi:prepilin-type N-terminal cleavage/methylation domain-containing protein